MEPLYWEVHPSHPPHHHPHTPKIILKEADICVCIYFMSIENCFDPLNDGFMFTPDLSSFDGIDKI